MSYKVIIIKMLESQPEKWFYGHELEKVVTPWGWIGLRGTRDCRDLAKKGLIQVNHDEKYVRYKAIKTQDTKIHWSTEYKGVKLSDIQHQPSNQLKLI